MEIRVMATMIFKKLLKDNARLKEIAFKAIENVITEDNIDDGINSEIAILNSKLDSNRIKKEKLLNTYIEGFIEKETYISKLKEYNEMEEKLKNKIEEISNTSGLTKIDIKDKIKQLKNKIETKLEFDIFHVSAGMIDSLVDKVIVHGDNRYEWKLNCISEVTKYSTNETELGIYFGRLIITEDDIRNYNKKTNYLKKVFQKKPMIVEIYL
jgi:hypothetical protein